MKGFNLLLRHTRLINPPFRVLQTLSLLSLRYLVSIYISRLIFRFDLLVT